MRQLYTWSGNDALLKALNNENVEFLVVGGVAMNFYDETRAFDDLDLMVRQTTSNAEKLITALINAGLNPMFTGIEFATPAPKQFSLKDIAPGYYADIISSGEKLQIDVTEWSKEPCARLNNFHVRIASLDLMLDMKRSGNRTKDQDDLKRLLSLLPKN